jgi:hypothetical protein
LQLNNKPSADYDIQNSLRIVDVGLGYLPLFLGKLLIYYLFQTSNWDARKQLAKE